MKTKWNVLIPVLTLALMLCMLCTVAFAEECPMGGEHDYYETYREESTCTVPGLIEYTCSKCNKSYTEDLPLAPHDDYETYREESTCQVQGLVEYTCRVCNRSYTEDLPLGPHDDYETYREESTCQVQGLVEYTCRVCNRSYTEDLPLADHTWDEGVVTKPATYEEAGIMTYTCTVCQTTKEEPIPKLTPTQEPTPVPSTPTPAPANPTKKPSNNNSNNNAAPAAPAATEVPALPYGSIVSDIERADEPYVPETVADDTGANTILVITADPDEDGTYTLRNLHITDALLSQLNSEGILTVRFVVGDATVEFPVASYTGDAVTTIKGDLDADVTAFLVTIDPNATTADGQPGVSVGSSVVTADAAEYDVTPLIPDLTLTIGDGASQPVTTASVYTAAPAAPAEPAVEEVPAEPAVEEPAADEAVAA